MNSRAAAKIGNAALIEWLTAGAPRCGATRQSVISKNWESIMKLATELFTATFVIGAATLALPANAAPITAPAGLQNASGPRVQTVQWLGGGNIGTQYGPDYDYYGPRYGSGAYQVSPGYNAGEQVGGTQYGPDYGYYGPRYGSGAYQVSPGYNAGEQVGGTQYGPDYDYNGPRYGSGDVYNSFAYSPGATDQSYCQQRFRSFDPASGTYMGYDGRRHPCQ
jgi:hypothetical protein